MKIQAISFVFFSVLVTSFAAIDPKACKDCDESIEDAQQCIIACDTVIEDESFDSEEFDSLFDYCYIDKKGKKVKKLKDLSSCCKMTKDCENTLKDLESCLSDCFDPCLKNDALAYRDCLRDRNCDYSCFRESDGALDFGDIADLTVKDAKCDDIEKDFYEDFCKAGKRCCSKCTTEQASVLDCVFNKNVLPYLNSTLPAETQSPTAAPTIAPTTSAPTAAPTPNATDAEMMPDTNATVTDAPVDSGMSFPTDAPAAATPAQRQLMSSKWDGEYLYTCPVASDCKYRRLSGDADINKISLAEGGRALATTDDDDEGSCADVMVTAYAQGNNVTTAAAAYLECVFTEENLQEEADESGAVATFLAGVAESLLVVGSGVTFWTLFN